MNIFMFSLESDGVTLCQQMAQEGNQVSLYIQGKGEKEVFDGIVFKTDDWQDAAKQAEFTIFDRNGNGRLAEGLREKGVKVWNGHRLADRLEADRRFGMEVYRKAGINIPETYDFPGASEARKLVEGSFKASDRMVIKLDGAAGAATSYVAKNRADMMSQLDSWEENPKHGDLSAGGILQRFVAGTEVSIEGWWNGENFMYPYNLTFEDKKLLNDDKGPNTGCSQNIVLNVRSRHPRLAKLVLEPLAPMLRKAGYIGQIDTNSIVSDEDGLPYALEFTPRCGYESTPTLTLSFETEDGGGFGKAVCAALSGERDLPLGPRGFDLLAGIRTYLPPYPWDCPPLTAGAFKTLRGVPVEGWTMQNRRVLLCDVLHEDEKFIVAGTCGIPFVALGHGKTWERTISDVFKHLEDEGVYVPNLGYRTDIGERAKKALARLDRLGLI